MKKAFFGGGVLLGGVMCAQGATFNGNEHYDIFVVNNSQQVLWYEATGNGPHEVSLVRTLGAFIGNNSTSLAAGDLDGSGTPDLIVGRESGTPWFRSDGTATGIDLVEGDTVGNRDAVAIGDVDQTGNQQLWSIWNITETGGTITRAEFTGGSSFGGNQTFAAGGTALAVGDVSGDGTDEVLAARTDRITWAVGDGAGGFDSNNILGSAVSGLQSLAFGDVNNSGTNDLFGVNPNGNVLWFEIDNGSLSFREIVTGGASAVEVADLNADGTPTLLVGGSSSAVTWWEYDAGSDSMADVGGTAFQGSGIMDIVAFPVPEPGTAGLLATAGLLLMRRR